MQSMLNVEAFYAKLAEASHVLTTNMILCFNAQIFNAFLLILMQSINAINAIIAINVESCPKIHQYDGYCCLLCLRGEGINEH